MLYSAAHMDLDWRWRLDMLKERLINAANSISLQKHSLMVDKFSATGFFNLKKQYHPYLENVPIPEGNCKRIIMSLSQKIAGKSNSPIAISWLLFRNTDTVNYRYCYGCWHYIVSMHLVLLSLFLLKLCDKHMFCVQPK